MVNNRSARITLDKRHQRAKLRRRLHLIKGNWWNLVMVIIRNMRI